MEKLKVVLIGADGRGNNYTSYMIEDKFNIVAVAEPVKDRRESFQRRHKISDEMCFDTWEKLLEMGYNLLLEKPIAPTTSYFV